MGGIKSANAKYLNCSFVTRVLSFLFPCPPSPFFPPLPPPLSLAGAAVAQRVVMVESGPLIRTEGSHVTIWCNVTGYKEGTEQNFEWSMYLPSVPDREIRIVSTATKNYAYAVYSQRVTSGEIFVEKLSSDSALLHITKVQAKDQGLFECYTPNTDGQYLGSYSARTNLTGESVKSARVHTETCLYARTRTHSNHISVPQILKLCVAEHEHAANVTSVIRTQKHNWKILY